MSSKKKRRLYSYVALTVIFAVLYYTESTKEVVQQETKEVVEHDTIPEYIPTYYYGIVVDSLNIFEGTIKRNQRLADILLPYQISNDQLYLASINSKKVFDVRKFGARKPYSILYEGDSIKKATHFIYRPNPVDFVVFDFQDSVQVYAAKHDIEVIEKELTGDIQTSLYVDMLEDGGNVELVNKLVDIFAWQVDFFGIQQGDVYKLVYNEHYVGDNLVSVGDIKAAYFNHKDEGYYAFNFDQGDGSDYFNRKGESLRREFLKAPLTFTRISSRYTGRRYHPVQKRFKAHLGTDYAAPRGTPIFAAADGMIIDARYKANNGNFVKIQHNGNLATQYLHMSKIARGIRKGKKVKRGQTIGFVGSTGLASGPHLCYRFWKNGRQVDALKVKLPPSNPILEENKMEFDSIQSIFTERLDILNLPIDSVRSDVMARLN
ncbi:MAG: peptidoglycan DD-metalloendopeptidase family protein [Reichenbachiella sp.]